MGKVFVSYKAEDRPRVAPLVAALEADGFDVWWDQQIGGGSNWRDEIERNLEGADCVLVAWSERAVGPEGRFVRDEATRAQEAGVYLPLAIDDVRPPLGFGEVQALAMAGWKGDRSDPRYQDLLSSIRSRLDGSTAFSPAPVPTNVRSSRRVLLLGAAGLAGVATLGGTAWVLTKGRKVAGKLAVMPFQNLSGDATQDYFAAGISEELRSALSRIGLSVIGRESTEAVKSETVREIAKRLDVSHVLSGSVRRGSGTIKVNTTLVDGDDGVNIWSRDYERAEGDALSIQAAVAERVADALQLTVGDELSGVARLGGTRNAEALDAYLRAEDYVIRHGLSPATITSYLSLMDQALAADPKFVLALLGRARWTYFMEASGPNEGARAASRQSSLNDFEKALKLAPNFPMTHARYASFELQSLDFEKALEAIAHPSVSNSTDPAIIEQAAYIQAFIGAPDVVMEAINRLPALDPLSPRAFHRRATSLLFLGRYPEALKAALRAAELAPENVGIARGLIINHTLNDQFAKAEEVYRRFPDDAEGRSLYGLALAKFGRVDEAAAIYNALDEEFGNSFAFQMARYEAVSGDREAAFNSLERAMERYGPDLALLMRDPFLTTLHEDPRFISLLKRLNYPYIDPHIAGA